MSKPKQNLIVLAANRLPGGVLYGANGQTITGNSSGAWTIAANGTNQSITLTPSGTGLVVIGSGATPGVVSQGGYWVNANGGNSGAIGIYGGSSSSLAIYTNNSERARFSTGGNLLLGGLTTDGTGVLQFPVATTIAGGITFGTDVNFYRFGTGTIGVNGSTDTGFLFLSASSVVGRCYIASGSNMFLDYPTGQSLLIRTAAGTTALTIDSSQNATFAGTTVNFHGAAAAVSSSTKFIKAITAIADNTATTVLTITVPNAAHSAAVRVRILGSLGAGGAIGANEASQVITYDIGVARTAGVAMNAVASTAFGSSTSVAVAGAATIAVSAALTLNAEGVSVTNTASLKVTIARGSGTSTNHTCLLIAEVLNANSTGVTIS